MPEPFETLRWIVVALYEIFRDPGELVPLVRSMAIGFAVSLPFLGALWSLRLYAKRHGREMPDDVVHLANSREPFVDPRLNEPFDLIRRSWPLVAASLLVGGTVAAFAVGSVFVFGVGCFLAGFAIGSKRLFVEACLAFGAKPAPAPERADTPAPISGT
jgi:hypothetical protein